MSGIVQRLRHFLSQRSVLVPLVGALGIAGLAVGLAFALGSGDSPGATPLPSSSGPQASPSVSPSRQVSPEGEHATVATTTVDQLEVFAEAGGGSPAQTLGRWSDYGQVRTLLVVGDDGTGAWLQVLLPLKPNGQTGWVRASDVTLSTTTLVVNVDLSERRLELVDTALGPDASVVLEASVVIGAPETPTPVGNFYVTDPLDLQANPTGVYGAYALGLSGYSEVLATFNGAPPQIAIHGTNEPSQLGEAISNGCIRVSNDVVLQLAGLLPLGTPVVIEE